MTSNLPLVKASRMIHIRSENRDVGSNEAFTVKLNQPISINDLNQSIFVSLISAIIPNTYNNITTKNQRIDVEYEKRSTTPVTIETKQITIPAGCYTSDSFCAKLKELLEANKPTNDSSLSTLTISVDPNTSYLSFLYYSVSWKLKSITIVDDIYKNFSLTSSNTIFSTVTAPTSDQTKIVISSIFNLSLMNELRVVLTNLNTNEVYNNYDKSNTLILSNILINSGSFSFIYHYPSYRNSIMITDQTIDRFDIQLQDTYGNVVNLNGVPWSLSIRCDFRKTSDDTVNKVSYSYGLFKK